MTDVTDNFCLNRRGIAKDTLVVKAQHPVSEGFQIGGAGGVRLFLFLMHPAIDFHYQEHLCTAKIHNETTNAVLPLEFESLKLPIPQAIP